MTKNFHTLLFKSAVWPHKLEREEAVAGEDPIWVLGNHKRLVHEMSVVNY